MRRALLLAALVLLACGRPVRADAPTAADLVRALGGDDVVKRSEAYSALLAKHPPEALPLLAKALPGMPLTAQQFGISVVQGYPPADTKPVYERWATSDTPLLVVAGGVALLRAGDAKQGAAIAKALSLPSLEPAAIVTMLSQLYAIRDAKVIAAVRARVRTDATVDVVGAALFQLHSASDDGGVKVVTPLLGAPTPGLRALAAAYLVCLGDDTKADALATELVSGELPYAEFMRVQNLISRTSRCPDKVLDALVTLVGSDPKGYYLPYVIDLLGQFAYPKAVPVLKTLLERDDAAVSKSAFEALSRIPGALTPDVTKALLEAKDESRRVAAAEALLRGDDPSGLAAVVDVLRHGKTARAAAATALGAFRSRAAVEPLIDALGDPDLSVRAGAYNSLVTLLRTLFPYRRLDLASTGYVTTAAEDVRTAAIAKIRAWWDAHKEAGW